MECSGLAKSQDQKHLLRDKGGLSLFIGLRHMRKHDIMDRDAYSLSILKEKGTLNISRARVFL